MPSENLLKRVDLASVPDMSRSERFHISVEFALLRKPCCAEATYLVLVLLRGFAPDIETCGVRDIDDLRRLQARHGTEDALEVECDAG